MSVPSPTLPNPAALPHPDPSRGEEAPPTETAEITETLESAEITEAWESAEIAETQESAGIPPGSPSGDPHSKPHLVARAWEGGWTFLYGGVGLLAGLAVLAAVPILQFVTLGWLLEAEGRLARGEGWRHGVLPGMRKAAPLGSGLIGCAFLALPFLVLYHFYLDAELLSAGSAIATNLWRATTIYGAFACVYATMALASGRGSLLAFVTPFKNLQVLFRHGELGGARLLGRAHAWSQSLRFGHYLAQGVRGFLAAAIWLSPPTLLLASAKKAPLLGLLGALLLVLVLRSALVAQARLAAEGRFKAAFEWREIRNAVKRAPLATALALVLTLGLALPLYLLKVQLLPRDALWLTAILFLLAMWPARVVTGWALKRGKREGRAHWSLRLLGTAIALPAAGFYVFMLFFSQYFAWRGSAGLFAHHAFLLPVSFY